MDNKKFLIVLAVIATAFIGILVLNNKNDKGQAEINSKESSNYYGKMDSTVTLTEYVDFQCEACYAYYPYMKQVKELYKDKVRFRVAYFPIASSHQFALQAARSAEAAARQGKFWEMHDKLFEGQKEWEVTTDPQSFYNRYASEIGLDMQKFDTDRRSSSVNAVVQKDLQKVQELGGTGTPTFVLNDKKIESPKPSVEALSKVLDDALAKQQR